jgi:hypothetical protein
MAGNKYVEQGRVQVDESTQVAVTNVVDRDGVVSSYFLNNFVTSESYTGPKKGCTIKKEFLADVLSYLPTVSLQEALALQKNRKE